MAVAPLLESDYALVAAVLPCRQNPGALGAIRAYLANPMGTAKLPSVVVIHENRGPTPHIEDADASGKFGCIGSCWGGGMGR